MIRLYCNKKQLAELKRLLKSFKLSNEPVIINPTNSNIVSFLERVMGVKDGSIYSDGICLVDKTTKRKKKSTDAPALYFSLTFLILDENDKSQYLINLYTGTKYRYIKVNAMKDERKLTYVRKEPVINEGIEYIDRDCYMYGSSMEKLATTVLMGCGRCSVLMIRDVLCDFYGKNNVAYVPDINAWEVSCFDENWNSEFIYVRSISGDKIAITHHIDYTLELKNIFDTLNNNLFITIELFNQSKTNEPIIDNDDYNIRNLPIDTAFGDDRSTRYIQNVNNPFICGLLINSGFMLTSINTAVKFMHFENPITGTKVSFLDKLVTVYTPNPSYMADDLILLKDCYLVEEPKEDLSESKIL